MGQGQDLLTLTLALTLQAATAFTVASVMSGENWRRGRVRVRVGG